MGDKIGYLNKLGGSKMEIGRTEQEKFVLSSAAFAARDCEAGVGSMNKRTRNEAVAIAMGKRMKELWADPAWRARHIAVYTGVHHKHKRRARHGEPGMFVRCHCQICVGARRVYNHRQYLKRTNQAAGTVAA
ncbi:MAG: hypothetical protein ACLP19_18965 [Xanthobacteraceae bacterium]